MATGSRDETAVSPVVGVLVMVAITAALSTTVAFLLSDLQERSVGPAHVTLWTVPASPEARVMQADLGLDWATDVVVSGSCLPLLNGGPFPTVSGTPVNAGDVLTCDPGEDLVVGSSADRGNTLLYQDSF